LDAQRPSVGMPLAPEELQDQLEGIAPLASEFKTALLAAAQNGNWGPQQMVGGHVEEARLHYGNTQVDAVALPHLLGGSTPNDGSIFSHVDLPAPRNFSGKDGLMERVLKRFPEEPAFQLLRSEGVSREFVCPPSESEAPQAPNFQS